MKKRQFKEEIDAIFGYTESYVESKMYGTIEFVVDEFTAEKLFALSDLLGTGTIRSRGVSSSGCVTCGIDNQIEISASDVKFKD